MDDEHYLLSYMRAIYFHHGRQNFVMLASQRASHARKPLRAEISPPTTAASQSMVFPDFSWYRLAGRRFKATQRMFIFTICYYCRRYAIIDDWLLPILLKESISLIFSIIVRPLSPKFQLLCLDFHFCITILYKSARFSRHRHSPVLASRLHRFTSAHNIELPPPPCIKATTYHVPPLATPGYRHMNDDWIYFASIDLPSLVIFTVGADARSGRFAFLTASSVDSYWRHFDIWLFSIDECYIIALLYQYTWCAMLRQRNGRAFIRSGMLTIGYTCALPLSHD